ncbi:uncharacterized protein N7473_010340 [Penicillium subrubescens]|uniref:uncharacterized protein n=1 Tax=Penicillium subrubescens TaxID=1316194 RepID=UPI0025453396|nr:uncharacterized protein N7473_010340 [Penicillium subrubescens]KAJ5883454.1 hypothetical protein N7473_010340 [Penicillium subrubescens]
MKLVTIILLEDLSLTYLWAFSSFQTLSNSLIGQDIESCLALICFQSVRVNMGSYKALGPRRWCMPLY